MNNVNYILNNMEKYIGDKPMTTVEKGNRFLKWCLYYLFDKSDTEIESNDLDEGVLICDGTNDGGVDAAFKEVDGIHILQTKYGKSHSYEQVIAFLNKMKNFITESPKCDWNENTNEIYNVVQEADEVFIYYITNEQISNANYKDIEKLSKEVEELITNNFENKRIVIRVLDIDKMSDFIDENTSMVPRKFKGTWHHITVEKYFINKENNTVIAEVALKTLAGFIKKSEKYLFYSNIRNFLGKNRVNKKIAETYEKYPKNFWFYNNGITVVCDDFVKKSDLKDGAAKIDIQTPQIVNGCQTASTIYTQWKKDDPKSRNDKEGTILVKIIKDTNNKRKEITRYTNNQTAVTGKDFFALEEFHQKLKKDFENLGYSYEIQRREKGIKAKGNDNYRYLFDKKFKNSFFAKDVVQAFAAGMHLKPAKARSINNLVPGGSYYNKLFNDDATPQNPKYYLFPYSVMYYSKYILEHNKNDRYKSANLLYISIYFRLLLKIFIKLNILDEDTIDLIHCDNKIIDYIDKIFMNEDLNKQLLDVSNSVLKDFFKDSKIREDKIGDNLPKFLKSTVENDPEVITILNDKIEDEFDEENIDLEKIKGILFV